MAKIIRPRFGSRTCPFPIIASDTERHAMSSPPTGQTPLTTLNKIAEITCDRKDDWNDCFSSSDIMNKLEAVRVKAQLTYNWGNTWDEECPTGTESNDLIHSTGKVRAGERITLDDEAIWKVSVELGPVGSPNGTVYLRVRKVSDDSILGEDSMSATLITGKAWYTFTPAMSAKYTGDVRLSVEYPYDGTNYIYIWFRTTDVWSVGQYTTYISSWSDDSGKDAMMKYKLRPEKDLRIYKSGVQQDLEITLSETIQIEDDFEVCADDNIELRFKVDDTNTEDDDTFDLDYFKICYDWGSYTADIKGEWSDTYP